MSAQDAVVASKELPAPPRQPRFSLRAPRDPGFAALRRAARAAIVIPLAFALGTFGLHLGQNVIFIVFGCFALLVITDFGGLRPARARAYLTATAVGAVLVALGTLVSLTIAAAAAVTFLVALVISFARVFAGISWPARPACYWPTLSPRPSPRRRPAFPQGLVPSPWP